MNDDDRFTVSVGDHERTFGPWAARIGCSVLLWAVFAVLFAGVDYLVLGRVTRFDLAWPLVMVGSFWLVGWAQSRYERWRTR